MPPATVLVVDDSSDHRHMAKRMLSSLGLDVLLADGGEQALELVRRRRPDLILMDCQMPGMDGVETVRRLRFGGCTVPVLGVTANVTAEKRAACGAAGFDDVLTKPIRLEQLERELAARLSALRAPTALQEAS
jgi:CheY-like chemotaxis protein